MDPTPRLPAEDPRRCRRRDPKAKERINAHEPPNLATASAMRWPNVASRSMISFGWRIARTRTSCCAAWNWRPRHPKHFHARQGLALQENGDVLTVHFDTDGLVDGNGVGLVRSLLEHGGEAEELAVSGLIDHDLLMLLIDGGDANAAGNHDVGASVESPIL